MFRTCVTLALLAGAVATAADEKPLAREIPTKDLKLTPPREGKATEPTIITTAEELAKSPVVGQAADELKKQVDFGKEKLLVFAWSGSGQDKLAVVPTKADKKDATALRAVYTPGRTRDLRQHVKLFAVPKETEFQIPK